jgi:hypothetical protein
VIWRRASPTKPASLAQIDPDHLIVKGRIQATGDDEPAAEIGQELSVDYPVESSVQAEGGRLRVTVTLIRAQSGHPGRNPTIVNRPACLACSGS